MEKTYERNNFALTVLLVTATVQITGLPMLLGQDMWIALLFTIVPVFPMLVVYYWLSQKMPGKNIFQMIEFSFGKTCSQILSFFLSAYCIYAATLTLNNYSRFIHLTSLFKTPVFLIGFLLAFASLYMAKSGFDTIGKWASLMFKVSIIIAIFSLGASINFIDLSKLLPIATHSAKEIINGSLKLTVYPFCEVFILLFFLGHINGKKIKTGKIFFGGVFFALFLIILTMLRTVTILGPNVMDAALFPIYKADGIIKIGSFFQRVEGILGYIYVLSSIIKVGIYILAGSFALTSAIGRSVKSCDFDFNKPDNKMLIPVSAISLLCVIFMFGENPRFIRYAEIFGFASIPFQIIIPVILCVVIYIKMRKSGLGKRG